jgi:hypothetical protein
MEWEPGTPEEDGDYYFQVETLGQTKTLLMPLKKFLQLPIVSFEKISYLGPITPAMIESYNPEWQAEQHRALLRLLDILKSAMSDAGHTLDIIEETMDLRCPACGAAVDSLRDLLTCECGDMCCDECIQMDGEGVHLCPECWRMLLQDQEGMTEAEQIHEATEGRR